MNIIEIIGFIAGSCTTFAFFPQVMRVWQTRSVKDISLGMYILFCVGVSLWIVYGWFLKAFAVIAANVITLGFALTILILKIRWDSNKLR